MTSEVPSQGQLPEGIARLTPRDPANAELTEGLLSVRPSVAERRLGGRPRPYGRDTVDYAISWVREDGTPFLFDDGTGDTSDPVVRGIMDGVVALYGDSYAVRWLNGQEFRDANRTMGDPL